MSDDPVKKRHRTRTVLAIVAVTVLCLSVVCVVAVKIYLASSLPAAQLSRFLSSYLQEKVAISSVSSSGATIYLRDVRIANPPGFGGDLLRIRSVAIAPQWRGLLSGERRFDLISLEGASLDIEKNARGTWNYAHLQRVLASRPPSRKETYVRDLTIRDGIVSVNSRSVKGVSVKVHDFAAKGSLRSSLEVTGEDTVGNRYRLTGHARPGASPGMDLTLSAPDLALKGLSTTLKLKEPALLENGKGNLSLHATLEGGIFRADGLLYFSGIHPAQAPELAGKLSVNGEYDPKADRAQIGSARLVLNRIGEAHGSGVLHSLKQTGTFEADLASGGIDLGQLPFLVPQQERSRTRLAGVIAVNAVHLSGTTHKGLTGLSGTLLLKNGSVTRDGKVLAAGIGGDLELARGGGGYRGKGVVRQGTVGGPVVVRRVKAPFTFVLSSHRQPLDAELSALEAEVAGIPLTGSLSYRKSRADRLVARVMAAGVSARALNPYLARYGYELMSGTVSATVTATGPTTKALRISTDAEITALQGRKGDQPLGVERGRITARINRGANGVTAGGHAALEHFAFAGKKGSADFAFGYGGRKLTVEGAKGHFAGMSFTASAVALRVPAATPSHSSRLPIEAEIKGCNLFRGDLWVKNLNGSMRGGYNRTPAGKWMDGTASAAADAVSWRGKLLGTPVAHVRFDSSGGHGDLRAKVAGGDVTATAVFDPFRPAATTPVSLAIKSVSLRDFYGMLPQRPGAAPAAGTVDGEIQGEYRKGYGLAASFRITGKGVGVKGAGGKAIISDAGVTLRGGVDGKTVSFDDAGVTLANGLTLHGNGELRNAFTPDRKGAIAFTIPETSVNSVLDIVVNSLPRFLQEATVEGTLSADGKIGIGDGKLLLEGALALHKVRLENRQQKFIVEGVDGEVPVALDLSGKTEPKTIAPLSYSRGNYPELLVGLRRAAAGSPPSVSVGRIALGNLELGRTTMHLEPGQGSTAISYLESSLYGGTVLGRGEVSFQRGVKFRTDLLVNGVSLKGICGAIPGVTGYISGKVDGIISTAEIGKGLEGIVGFVDLWAREGKGEKMLVSKEFLQRLSKRKISGFFFHSDRRYDKAEISATLEEGMLSFEKLDIIHTNFLGMKDLSVTIAPTQNRIELKHLFTAIKEAASRSKAGGTKAPAEKPSEAPSPEFKWEE